MSALVPACSGKYRVLPPLPETLRGGTPFRTCRKSLTLSLHSLAVTIELGATLSHRRFGLGQDLADRGSLRAGVRAHGRAVCC